VILAEIVRGRFGRRVRIGVAGREGREGREGSRGSS